MLSTCALFFASATASDAQNPLSDFDRDVGDSREIAVVGMSCRFPGGIEGPAMLWDVAESGRSVITKVPFSRWDVAIRR